MEPAAAAVPHPVEPAVPVGLAATSAEAEGLVGVPTGVRAVLRALASGAGPVAAAATHPIRSLGKADLFPLSPCRPTGGQVVVAAWLSAPSPG